MTTSAAAATAGRRFRAKPQGGGLPSEATIVSRYPLDGGSAVDDVGGVNGTVVGAWTSTTTDSLVAGVAGQSFYKAGTNAHFKLPANNPAHAGNARSINFYVQPTASSAKHVLLAGSDHLSTQPGDFSIERLPNGMLRGFHVGSDGGLRFFGASSGIVGTNLVVGTAYRITVIFGPSGAKLYLNNTQVATIPENANGWNNTREKFFGIWVDGVLSPAEGVFDHVSIFDGELTASGIAALEPAQSITLEGPSGGVDVGQLNAFEVSSINVTALPSWPAGRTPKSIVTQGARAFGYVRRGWKPTNNTGTHIDFQAGWRKTINPESILLKLDDNSEIGLNYTVAHNIPAPGAGGTTRTLDKLGGADFTTWSAAIAGCATNDVLVVRARAGGEMYPSDVNVGGATNASANGVKVVAHPDDLAAGRRPRIHVQGTKFARYADELNAGHWQLHQNLGSPHGSVWRTVQVVGSLVNIGCSYRTKSGGLRRCYTYTNTPGTPGALARLTDTTYPRVHVDPDTPSEYDLYQGPGIYLHSDGRLYIRLSALRDGVGAIQVNKNAGVGPTPPWDWSDDDPANEDPNQCQLYISSSNDSNNTYSVVSTNISYALRINGRTNWTLENLDFVGGGDTIQARDGANGLTMRGCRILGWCPPNMAAHDNTTTSGVGQSHSMLELEGTFNFTADRCEFWGGAVPWGGWDENKARHGAYPIASKLNLWFSSTTAAEAASSVRFVNCICDGFWVVCRFGSFVHAKFHQSSLRYWGMDGCFVVDPPTDRVEYIRTQIFEGTFGGWTGALSNNRGRMYVGYCLVNNFRPFCHEHGWWNITQPNPNPFVCAKQVIGHENPRECERHFYYNTTSIGAHNHLRTNILKANNAAMVADGAGAFLHPSLGNHNIIEWWSRNNVLAVRPNGSLGDSAGTTAGNSGDSHVSLILHPAHMGFNRGGATYSVNHNIYHRGSGMPSVGNTGVITTVNSGSTEQARNSITDVRNDTGQEQDGSFADPLFTGTWSATKLDRELHTNAFWCLQAGSPAASGGDTTDRTWPDLDFGTVVNYGGNSWRGCMDPEASAVEQQVGPLGPLPSGL